MHRRGRDSDRPLLTPSLIILSLVRLLEGKDHISSWSQPCLARPVPWKNCSMSNFKTPLVTCYSPQWSSFVWYLAKFFISDIITTTRNIKKGFAKYSITFNNVSFNLLHIYTTCAQYRIYQKIPPNFRVCEFIWLWFRKTSAAVHLGWNGSLSLENINKLDYKVLQIKDTPVHWYF